ncbi:HEPN domain-containing protein [Verrucomicrobiota bacterium]
MTEDNARANARDEMDHGNEALEAARCLVDNGFRRDAVSRAYYAAYHWARAVLLLKGIEPRTHRGTIQLFSLHLAKDGPLTDETVGLLAHLETYRELSDYTPSARFTEHDARSEIERAERFIAACKPLAETK